MATTRSLRKNKPPPAFYETPSQQTSTKIIAEARKSIRSLPTERPFTPADSSRNLFGTGASQSRPPSVYSIGARHFSDEKLSRPPTGHAAAKLEPIEKTMGATEHIRKAAAKRERPTPPTPVQSLQDLTTSFPPHHHEDEPTDRVPRPHARTGVASHTILMVGGGLESASGSSVSSAELEPKPSQFSPPISKRSFSGGIRVLSGGSGARTAGCIRRESGRAFSAESRGSEARRASQPAPSKDDVMMTSSAKPPSQPQAIKTASSQPSSKKHRAEDPKASRKSTAQSDSKHRTKPDPHNRRPSSSSSLPAWDAEVAPLLSELDSTPYSQEAHLCQLADALWSALEAHSLLGRGGGAGGSKRRASVLRSVFKLLDHKDPRLLLKVAKIILAMRVTGKNMTNVCKLLFSLAKNEQNDTVFAQERITTQAVELLSSADLASDSEALVYGLGTVKLLASNAELRDQLASSGVMALVSNTLQGCTENSSVDRSHASNILVQLTGALRNLSDSSPLRDGFLSSPLLPQLASVLSDHMTSTDIVFNISRLLSKLSQQADFQEALSQSSSLLLLFLQALSTHSSHADIVVRLCFVLGNLTSSSADTRETLFFGHSPLPLLNQLFTRYFAVEERPTKQSSSNSSSSSSSSSNSDQAKQRLSKADDVLIKLVRLVANLSVHPEVGPAVANDDSCVNNLLKILAVVSLGSCEELVLNTLATLNNLSYYAEEGSAFTRRHRELAEVLVGVIVVDSSEGLLECTRVYGNLSRHADVRQVLAERNITELMVTVLDSGSREVVYSACGVLLNLMADQEHRATVAALGGVKKLVEVLEDFGRSDWQLASVVCKTLWNYSENLTSFDSLFGEDEARLLVHLLKLYSEPKSSSSKELPTHDLATIAWETEFLPVAKDLLSRLRSHHGNLIALPTSDQVPPFVS